MLRLLAVPLLAAAGLLATAPAALARRTLSPLRDEAPVAAPAFHDRVLTGDAARAASTPAGTTYRLRTPDGYTLPVRVSSSYTSTRALARTYVTFLDSLIHGSELGSLRVVIGTPAQVESTCGSTDALACYDSANETMYVPGQQMSSSDGVTTSYVVAHEYGHHIATHRSNAPFSALDYGPKRWASYEHVCAKTIAGQLAPGNESTAYAENPGEAWAETNAQLRYPNVAWQFTSLLTPTSGAKAAARRDILSPWTTPRVKVLTGRLSAARRTRSFTLPVSLDGAVKLTLKGPAAANDDLTVSSGGTTLGSTHAPGSADTLSFRALCASHAGDSLTIKVTRRSGAGAFRLRVAYPG